jgi:hypothetical protein
MFDDLLQTVANNKPRKKRWRSRGEQKMKPRGKSFGALLSTARVTCGPLGNPVTTAGDLSIR